MKKTIALLTVLLLLFAATTALSACAPKEEPVTEEPVTSSLREEIIFSTEYSLKAYSYEKVSEFSDAVANLTESFIYPDISSVPNVVDHPPFLHEYCLYSNSDNTKQYVGSSYCVLNSEWGADSEEPGPGAVRAAGYSASVLSLPVASLDGEITAERFPFKSDKFPNYDYVVYIYVGEDLAAEILYSLNSVAKDNVPLSHFEDLFKNYAIKFEGNKS